jgi:hypothetical protein
VSQPDFDRLAQSIWQAPSRRSVLKLLVGAVTTALLPWRHAVASEDRGNVTGRDCSPVPDNLTCPAGREKAPRSDYTPSVNGCGAQKFARAGLRPAFDPPDGFDGADFSASCNAHDICYGTCNSNKAACDLEFLRSMRRDCANPLNKRRLARAFCYGVANTYFSAVDEFGQEPWAGGQRAACVCCTDCLTGANCGSNCCNECETCTGNQCVSKCGPCEVCVLGQCITRCKACETCVDGKCSPCSAGQSCCAGTCINLGTQKCCGTVNGDFPCNLDQTCCSNGTCCDANATCCPTGGGQRACIPAGNQNCNFQCAACGPTQTCCLSESGSSFGCCASFQTCDPRRGCV